MRVAIRYFASVREALGSGDSLEVPEGSTVGMVRDRLIARGGAHVTALARGRALRCALDHVLCDESAPVREGSEVAFFPPITGG
ncbi:MAG TPA: MoaD/ThiS family protein [Caldimonas sp.]|nr:MoaD/ThiS family protein [Caldimonas sp.]